MLGIGRTISLGGTRVTDLAFAPDALDANRSGQLTPQQAETIRTSIDSKLPAAIELYGKGGAYHGMSRNYHENDALLEPRYYGKKDMEALRVRSRGIILTDDYAPVENLLAPVATTRASDD